MPTLGPRWLHCPIPTGLRKTTSCVAPLGQPKMQNESPLALASWTFWLNSSTNESKGTTEPVLRRNAIHSSDCRTFHWRCPQPSFFTGLPRALFTHTSILPCRLSVIRALNLEHEKDFLASIRLDCDRIAFLYRVFAQSLGLKVARRNGSPQPSATHGVSMEQLGQPSPPCTPQNHDAGRKDASVPQLKKLHKKP